MPNFTHLIESGSQLILFNGEMRAIAYPTVGDMWIVAGATGAVPAGGFVWPFDPDDIASEWGYRVPPVSGVSDFHSGVDWPKPGGTPIKSAGPGVVAKIKGKSESGEPGGRSWGNRVLVDHGIVGGERLYTAYAHMRDDEFPSVAEDDIVDAGDIIGYVGSTGASSGNHLHFVTFIGGTRIGTVDSPINCVNPREFMSEYNSTGEIA